MRARCLWSLGLFACTACSSAEQEEVKYYPNGVVEHRVALTKQGVYTGLFTRFYPSGVKKDELPFSHGHLNGLAKRYYPSGQLMSVAVYKNGAQAGEVKSFYPTGELRSHGTVRQRTPYGPMRYYSRSGKLANFRLYDQRGKVVDYADFTRTGEVDTRYTQANVYSLRDTVQVGEAMTFEVILAGQTAQTVQVRLRGLTLPVDSVKGEFSAYRYLVKGLSAGRFCLAGGVVQPRTPTTSTWFPWEHCFVVVAATDAVSNP